MTPREAVVAPAGPAEHGQAELRTGPLAVVALAVPDARHGVLILAGTCRPVPGLPSHPLLDPSSATVEFVRRMTGVVFACFLAVHERELVKVSVFGGLRDADDARADLLLLSPPTAPAGLTRRELEVLGLVVEGCSNRRVARTLRIAQRTAAAHVEHILDKLDCDSRCAAAVWAVREGAYIPSALRRG